MIKMKVTSLKIANKTNSNNKYVILRLIIIIILALKYVKDKANL